MGNRDSEQYWHGGTLGDRFADAGHAERPDQMNDSNWAGGGNDRKRSCFAKFASLGAAGVLAVMLAAAPFLPRRRNR